MGIVQLKIENGVSRVIIDGSAIIDDATQIYKVFVDVVEKRNRVVIDISKVSNCDTSFIQLICSLCHSLMRHEKSIEFTTDSTTQIIKDVVKTIGLHNRKQCSRLKTRSCIFTIFDLSQED